MKQRQSFSGFGFLILIMMMIWVGMIFFGKNAANQMTQQEFLTEVEAGNIHLCCHKTKQGNTDW